MTITEFLLARIAEDEAVALAVDDVAWDGLFDAAWGAVNDHGQRHDPARVLAECEAKRRIIELRYAWDLQAEGAPEAFKSILRTQVVTADTVVRTLAAVYADHPDYDGTWRP